VESLVEESPLSARAMGVIRYRLSELDEPVNNWKPVSLQTFAQTYNFPGTGTNE
jgi:hypothetical protein